ncbi:MAG: ABC transporter ATP-binding protein [Alphaproteobacteria bacterium]|jgi:branched-chain amino acid transport system ATP-binding protein|nr:ABC transporter ATP-binding protein [Rhodospirillaceae bacterium]MDP6404288.1 ABC transporter ATP-binding protein [Alphaproteobacteria bacterium]|tara:strand:+ start:1464 stop:2258 length:795 start_codon:yes stop_codon:yes gene_type:complete
MLTLNNVEVIFDNIILVLKGVSLEVPEGRLITLLGSNGAGKTTTLKAISALIKAERGQVTRGSIEFQGQRIDRMNPVEIVKNGIAQVFEGRRVFEHLNIRENLIAGAHINGNFRQVNEDIDRVLEYFPRLRERLKVSAGYLSGGEQQMLAIGRGLMSRPKLLMLDEPSLGLAPMLVEEIFGILKRLRDNEGVTMLLVEQNALMALSIADEGYVMENGKIVLSGSAQDLSDNADIREFYLGLSEGGAKKSFRDVKHYRRRKRWLS